MKRNISVTLLITLVFLSACGGKGGGDNNVSQAGPASAVLILGAEGSLPAGQTIGGIGVTINLPDGMHVKADGSGTVDASAVATSGVAQGQATVLALYSEATATAQAKLYLLLASNTANGFGTGELATVNCGIATGKNPHLSGINLTNVDFRDTFGAVITGLTLTIHAVAQ